MFCILCIMSSKELSFADQIILFVAGSFHAHFLYHLFDAATLSSVLTLNNLILFNFIEKLELAISLRQCRTLY